MRESLIIIALFCAFVRAASASEEGALAFRTFRFASGSVVVAGTQDDHGITSLHITAFRKSFTLTPAQLKRLHGLTVNGVQLSGEGGFRGFGGETLYLRLSMGFTGTVRESRFVVVSEEDGVSVQKKL